MTRRRRTLQLFDQYLNNTENWLFSLLDDLPDTDVVIASSSFVRSNFYSRKFEYLEFPLRRIEHNLDRLHVRIFNEILRRAEVLYPWYVARMAGKVDLMHSHFSVAGWKYRTLARKLKVPHIVSFYGYDYENLPHLEPIWRERYRILFAEADLFLCEGSHGAGILQKMGCPAEKIEISRLGVKIENIPYHERSKKPGELKLLQIARFIEKKGHIYTVRAFLEALTECPNMSLTLIGSNPVGIREELEDIIRGTVAEGKVVFADHIDFKQVHSIMRDYQVFIHPSCHSKDMDCEGGAPIVLLDAQATGMPVISTTHCDIPDEVVNGETGMLCNEKDLSCLAEAIIRFCNMGSEEYAEFAIAARNHVIKNYDSRTISGNLACIYEGICL